MGAVPSTRRVRGTVRMLAVQTRETIRGQGRGRWAMGRKLVSDKGLERKTK
jgi:hypothetical protein